MLLTAADLQEMARQTYRDSLAGERPLTVEQLAEQFGRSTDWAQDRIDETEQAEPATAIDDTPVEEPTVHNGNPHHPAAPVKPIEAAETPSIAVEAATTATTKAATNPDVEAGSQPTTSPEVVHRRGAWLVSWTAFVSGTLVSIAANIMHAIQATPEVAAWIGSAFWPIALLLAVEVITRVNWPHGAWYSIARYGGTGLVAIVAAIVSYRHMTDLLATWGEDTLNAHAGPLAVDGLMVVAGFALLAMSKTRGAH